MSLVAAFPSHKRGQKLAFSFDEDDLTLAWDAVRKANLAAGTKVSASLDLPAWWWAGTGLVKDDAAPLVLRAIATTLGPSVCLHATGEEPDVEAAAKAAYALAPTRPEAEWQRHRTARDAPDTEADFPLGAYVLAARHEAVTAERMRLADGVVASWTTIGAGAAPTEFQRLQEAVGAYHVALLDLPDGRRTVALWAGAEAPGTGQEARPVLRRLLRTQGAWRHGVKFTTTQQ
ncbi:MAG: hydroxymethylglutaryl-CoA synthase [Thermoplasmata archaeon]|jgi:hypothetical protein|nr:hydroxymethylglutaryl-CoA synthase [Thermoplasmata archaeon]